MYDEVQKAVLQYGLIKAGDRVGTAVSGGVDSMALLHALLRLSREMEFQICCLHFEHGIRGEDSKRDADFVRAAAEKLRIPYLEGSGDAPAHAGKHGMNLEAAARELRYAFFERARKELGLQKIALGHHMDDQAETMLLNLVRGCGLEGLGGMDYFRAPAYIRPLLGVSRRQIEAYAEQNGISYVTDQSNFCLDYSRNYIRHELMPSLSKLNPQAAAALARSASLLREDHEIIRGVVGTHYDETVEENGRGICVDLKRYAPLSPAVRKRVLRELFARHFDLTDMGKGHIDRLDEFALTAGTGKKMDIKCEVFATKSYGQLIISKKTYKIRKDGVFALNLNGRTELWDGSGFTCEPSERPEVFGVAGDFTQYVSRDSLEGVCVRTRRPGDVFSPLGMAGHKTLKEAMIDLKIPEALRDELPLLASGQGILWIPGYALGDKLRIGGDTKAVCRLQYFEKETEEK